MITRFVQSIIIIGGRMFNLSTLYIYPSNEGITNNKEKKREKSIEIIRLSVFICVKNVFNEKKLFQEVFDTIVSINII